MRLWFRLLEWPRETATSSKYPHQRCCRSILTAGPLAKRAWLAARRVPPLRSADTCHEHRSWDQRLANSACPLIRHIDDYRDHRGNYRRRVNRIMRQAWHSSATLFSTPTSHRAPARAIGQVYGDKVVRRTFSFGYGRRDSSFAQATLTVRATLKLYVKLHYTVRRISR